MSGATDRVLDSFPFRYVVMGTGVLCIVAGFALWGEAKCGQDEMVEGDRCLTIRNGRTGETTYEAERVTDARIRTLAVTVGIVLILGGLAVFPVEAMSRRRAAAVLRRGPNPVALERAREAGLGPHVRSGPVRGGEAHLFEGGVVVVSRKEIDVVRWDDVDGVYESREADRGSNHTYAASCTLATAAGGTGIAVRGSHREIVGAVLDAAVIARADRALLPMAAAVDAGETVEFGPVQVDAQGITFVRTGWTAVGRSGWNAPWRDVREVSMRSTRYAADVVGTDVVVTVRAGRPAPPGGTPLREVRDARLLLVLARALVARAEQADRADSP